MVLAGKVISVRWILSRRLFNCYYSDSKNLHNAIL